MQLNVLNDLAEAMKALDGRKKTDCLLAPSARPLVAHLLTKMDAIILFLIRRSRRVVV